MKRFTKIFSLSTRLHVAMFTMLATVIFAAGTGISATYLEPAPARVALNGNGELLVTDYTFGQVLTVDPGTLDIINEFYTNGNPLGIAWSNGLTYVGNTTTGQVEVFNEAGHEQFVLGHGQTPVENPQDIAVGNGNVYVVDGSDSTIKAFNLDGTFIGTIPSTGTNTNILANPTSIAIDDANQQIFVSDYGDLGSTVPIHPRIQVFDFDGALLFTINAGEPNKFRFTMPQGLSLNENNDLYVVDALTSEIHIFDTTYGTLLSKVKGSGITEGEFAMKAPLDLLVINSTNDLFVTNTMLASIKVFKGAGER